jgi:adenylylsulfate kinase
MMPQKITGSRTGRLLARNHKPMVLWFTGLSGSGKSSIATAVEGILIQQYNIPAYLIDGDVIRKGLNKDLGFTAVDRQENIRRIGEVARLMVDAGLIVLVAAISPFREDRQKARRLFPRGDFWEIYVECPLEICQKRDPKGLYSQARQGQISNFTGLTSPYEPPLSPEILLESGKNDIQSCTAQVVTALIKKRIIRTKPNRAE